MCDVIEFAKNVRDIRVKIYFGTTKRARPARVIGLVAMNLPKLMVIIYFCAIAVRSIQKVCFDRPPTIQNLKKAQLSNCKLGEHSVLYLGFFDFEAHFDIVRGFAEEWNQKHSNNSGGFLGLQLNIN